MARVLVENDFIENLIDIQLLTLDQINLYLKKLEEEREQQRESERMNQQRNRSRAREEF